MRDLGGLGSRGRCGAEKGSPDTPPGRRGAEKAKGVGGPGVLMT